MKAIRDYELIEEGDKVAVCISGGKDSNLLAKCLEELQKHGKVKFSIEYWISFIRNKRITDKSNVVDIGFGEYYIKVKDEKKELQEPVYSSWYESPKGGMQFREKLSIEYQVNKDYNNKNLRILKKVVDREKNKW